MRKGDIGATVASLQRQLIAVGFKIKPDAVFGPSTEASIIAFQKRAGLVADGIVGPKTQAALISGNRDKRLLSEAALEQAATRLDVSLAAIKAVNAVESNGRGFLDDGRPVILYERHVAHRLMTEIGADAEALAARFPNVINRARGGYVGGAAEWSRLATARQVLDQHFGIPEESCSWGQFQIMGYHWRDLGYASIGVFVDAMKKSEGEQLDAFCRFIEAAPALLKAIKARKWAEFARLYNGPAYKENFYDIKLGRAFDRYSPAPVEVAA